jgi:hypothetical protein
MATLGKIEKNIQLDEQYFLLENSWDGDGCIYAYAYTCTLHYAHCTCTHSFIHFIVIVVAVAAGSPGTLKFFYVLWVIQYNISIKQKIFGKSPHLSLIAIIIFFSYFAHYSFFLSFFLFQFQIPFKFVLLSLF